MYCNDTDILISALSNYENLENKEVYMHRSKTDFINVTGVAQGLISKCNIKLDSLSSIAIMYAISGSDQTSFQYGISKPKAWSTYLTHHVRMKNHSHYYYQFYNTVHYHVIYI